MAKALARMHVGDVHFYCRKAAAGDGVAQTDAGVGERAGVDNQAVRAGCVLLEEVDERALVVRLEGDDLGAQRWPRAS